MHVQVKTALVALIAIATLGACGSGQNASSGPPFDTSSVSEGPAPDHLEQGPERSVVLRDVPSADIESAGITVRGVVEGDDDWPITREMATDLAERVVCCGGIKQVSLVGLNGAPGTEFDGPFGASSAVVAWAVSFDTASGPASPPFGGPSWTSFTRDTPYFVVFFDAMTMKHIFSLSPGISPFPWDDTGSLLPRGVTSESLEAVGLEISAPYGTANLALDLPGLPEAFQVPEPILAHVSYGDWHPEGAVWVVNRGSIGVEPMTEYSAVILDIHDAATGDFLREVRVPVTS